VLVFALVCQQRSMVRVTGRIEPAVVDSSHLTGVVDVKPAARGESDCLQADVMGQRCATGREQHLVDFQLARIAQFQSHWSVRSGPV
jgi:hypothetical protein